MCKENSEQSDGQKAETGKKSKQKQKNKERKRDGEKVKLRPNVVCHIFVLMTVHKAIHVPVIVEPWPFGSANKRKMKNSGLLCSL